MGETRKVSMVEILKHCGLSRPANIDRDHTTVGVINHRLRNKGEKYGRDNFEVATDDTLFDPKCVEKVLLNLPTPLLIFVQDKNGIKHPCTRETTVFIFSIFSFCENQYPLDINYPVYFKDLHPSVQNRIEDFRVYFYVVKSPYTDDVRKLIQEQYKEDVIF